MKTRIWILLAALAIGYAFPVLAAPAAVPHRQGDSVSASYGDPNDMYLTLTVSGADFSQDPDGPPRLVGRYTGSPIHLSGTMIVSRGEGYTSYVTMSASLGDQSVQWPKEGEDNTVTGRTVELPFDLTFQVPADYEYSWISGSVFVQACGGVCGSYSVDITVELDPAELAPTPAPAPQSPCAEAMFFFPGMDLNGFFTGQQPLRLSQNEMTASLADALQRYIAEGNEVQDGVHLTDVHAVSKAFISSALPTGKEAALQAAARQLAQERQQTDPNHRLSPGDLFYLSLVQNNGNVRDALVTCHAALYRDSAGTNKQFIEQESILMPLRNPDGYVDGDYTYKTPRGSERKVNPRQELAQDEQGVWYHFFGLAALEFSDSYGSASFLAAWLAIYGGALPGNYTDQVLEHGFPVSNLGGGLGDMAIALEHNVRSNMGKPPDIAKYCINYYALAAGTGLKDAMKSHYTLKRALSKPYFPPLDSAGDILTPEGVVIYKSPLSILIQGTNGEWFSFDQREGTVDGNTAAIYFELVPEEDGTLGFVGVPFFEVASAQMTGVGEGPVTLGLYDHASEKSSVFEFEVRDGDQILVEGLTDTPSLNGASLDESAQASGIVPTGLPSASPLILLLGVGCCGILLLVVGGLVVFVSRGKRRSPRPALNPQPAESTPAGLCPHCGAGVLPGATFCGNCGRSLAPQVAAPPAASHPPTPVPAAADATVIAGGLAPAWQLAVESGPNAGRRYALGLRTRLGRSPKNEVEVSDAQASRQHAAIARRDDGYLIEDLNSGNGTFVNGSRIARPASLRPGDLIRIGATTLRVLES